MATTGAAPAQGIGIELAGRDDEIGQQLSAFLSLSRSGKALVSNEIPHDDGKRSLLVYVRKADGELAMAGVLLSEGVTRRAVVKAIRRAGVRVETLTGIKLTGSTRLD
jgi:hypothetical protein